MQPNAYDGGATVGYTLHMYPKLCMGLIATP
jgi:hypothetical protein